MSLCLCLAQTLIVDVKMSQIRSEMTKKYFQDQGGLINNDKSGTANRRQSHREQHYNVATMDQESLENPSGRGRSKRMGGLTGRYLMSQMDALMKVVWPSVVTP